MVPTEVALPELHPPADGLLWRCLVQIAESAPLSFYPLALSHGCTTAPRHCHHQWELPHSEELHPAVLPRAGRLRSGGSPVPWHGASCPACCNSTLLAAGSIFHLEQPCCGGWAGRAEGIGTDLLNRGTVSWGFHRWLWKLVCRFSKGREVIHKLHAYF